MNFVLLAPWLLVVITLSWGLWLTLRKVNPPSVSTKTTGLLAGVTLVLIVVGLAAGILPVQTQQPAIAPVASKLEALQAITNANRLQSTVIRVGDQLTIPSP